MKRIVLPLISLLFVVTTFRAHAQEVSLDDKIGQLLVVGFLGSEPSSSVVEAIGTYRIGGVIFFDVNLSDKLPRGGYGRRNIESPEQTLQLVDSLQKLAHTAGIPELFIAIDQEGGRVNRLKTKYGFAPSVSAAYQGRIGRADTTRKYAALTAQTLSGLGINIDFAPCVDLAVNPHNPIIAGVERAFGSDTKSVMFHSRIWVEELGRKRILTSLKHFPGHGSSIADSHLGLADVTKTWSAVELEPYRAFIADGYDDIVMVGHLFNSHLDPIYPSSLSKATIDILRHDMNYDGVIATDDMNMGAIVQNYSLEKALELALNAGVDMIVMGNNAAVFEVDLVERTVTIIKELVRSGAVSQQTIDAAYERIMTLKERL